MDIKAIRRVWRGQQFDSQLEAHWAATFTQWGMEYVYHPGRVFLANNDIYEPDFQLDCDVIFEVKGEHDDRIDKAWRCAAETGIPVIVGRSGWLPAGSNLEYAGAVWEPDDWWVTNSGSRLCFTQDHDVEQDSATAYLAYARGWNGIRMFKAVGDDQIV